MPAKWAPHQAPTGQACQAPADQQTQASPSTPTVGGLSRCVPASSQNQGTGTANRLGRQAGTPPLAASPESPSRNLRVAGSPAADFQDGAGHVHDRVRPVSTDRQSLDTQRDALTAQGCERILTDQLTGASTDRPGLRALFDYARSGD